MNERQLLTDFTKTIKKVPGLFWYKIPDTYGGQKKPFDVFAIYKGRPICIEFKKSKGKLEKHQRDNLEKVKSAGGLALIGVFVYDNFPKKKSQRTLLFSTHITKKIERKATFGTATSMVECFVLQYKEPESKEPYPKIQEFLDWAISL